MRPIILLLETFYDLRFVAVPTLEVHWSEEAEVKITVKNNLLSHFSKRLGTLFVYHTVYLQFCIDIDGEYEEIS